MNQALNDINPGYFDPIQFASQWAANENTRSLAIFGDPAVRLPG